jgi:hypothetical protein
MWPYESSAFYSPGFHLADDPPDKILQIFNLSAAAQQLPAHTHLFGIRD